MPIKAELLRSREPLPQFDTLCRLVSQRNKTDRGDDYWRARAADEAEAAAEPEELQLLEELHEFTLGALHESESLRSAISSAHKHASGCRSAPRLADRLDGAIPAIAEHADAALEALLLANRLLRETKLGRMFVTVADSPIPLFGEFAPSAHTAAHGAAAVTVGAWSSELVQHVPEDRSIRTWLRDARKMQRLLRDADARLQCFLSAGTPLQYVEAKMEQEYARAREFIKSNLAQGSSPVVDARFVAADGEIAGQLAPRPSREAMALGLLADHPEWTDTKIAKAAGVARTTLYSWPRYKMARDALQQRSNDRRRGRRPRQVSPDTSDDT